ncbi:MAG: MBL fold metallo-hydrolase [Saezia sp.]
MVNEVFPNIYTIEVPLPHNPLKALNAYVIKGEDRHLLIDTGFNDPQCFQALIRGLQQAKVPIEQLDIFITHLHADHCGLAASFPPSESRIVWASAEDSAIINDMVTKPELWDEFIFSLHQHGCDENTLSALTTHHPAKKYAPSEKINFTIAKEGDLLRYGSYEMQVLEVPGHTPGHLALYLPEVKILFGGDHILAKITPNIAYWPTMKDALASYLESLDKVYKLDIKCTLPSHRTFITDTHTRIAELKKHTEVRLQEICDILKSGHSMTATEVATKMHWHIKYDTWEDINPAQRWFAINEALSHLEHLVNIGKLSKEERDGKFYFKLLPTSFSALKLVRSLFK